MFSVGVSSEGLKSFVLLDFLAISTMRTGSVIETGWDADPNILARKV
jgi:hypothetical protein